MSSRSVVVVIVVVLAGAGGWFLLQPSSPTPATVASRAASPAARAPVAAAAPATAAPDTAGPSAAPRSPRKPAALPAPAPVEVAPTTATLTIESDVPGASVYLDRVGVGAAPVTIPDVAPGSHRLNVSAPGYEQYADTLDVVPGPRTVTVSFKDVRLDATVEVVHKHGMGSCRGQIVASPQGLRYNATDGKDNFSVALADIETFEMDYLAKNLRVKPRGGKTFNFSDPDGTADRLYFFHSTVDKVRKRVLAGK